MDANKKQYEITDYAVTHARTKAQQLVAKPEFARHEVEDIEQDMLTDLLEHMPKFDPRRAAYNTYAAQVIDTRFLRLLRDRRREMRDPQREECSLNQLVQSPEGELVERSQLIDQHAADALADRRSRSFEEEACLRADVSSVLSSLPANLRRIAECLRTRTVTETARILAIPRSTIYGAIERLRQRFEAAGLRDYL